MTWDFDDKERTALHEAGHAVVAWSFGVAVGCLYLDPKTKGGGAPIDSTTHLAPFEQIANWLAGFESEQAFKPPGRKYNAGKDFGELRRILRENGTSKDEPEGQALRERGSASATGILRTLASALSRSWMTWARMRRSRASRMTRHVAASSAHPERLAVVAAGPRPLPIAS